MNRIDAATGWSLGLWFVLGLVPTVGQTMGWHRLIEHQGLAAWLQAVGSVAAIGALVWQRRHEVRTQRERDRISALELQNGARRLVQAAVHFCEEISGPEWPASPPITDVDAAILMARVRSLAGALKQMNSHALPSWWHTEAVLVAVSAMDSLGSMLEAEVARVAALPAPYRSTPSAVAGPWVALYKSVAGAFLSQLTLRVKVLAHGLDVSMDPPDGAQEIVKAVRAKPEG
jgi:hypothetical protein